MFSSPSVQADALMSLIASFIGYHGRAVASGKGGHNARAPNHWGQGRP